MNRLAVSWLVFVLLAAPGFGQTPMPQQDVKARLDKAGIKYQTLQLQTNGCYILDIQKSSATNMTVLKGIPVAYLNISGTGVKDLAPLADMPLKALLAASTKITDLAPLKGKKLQYVDIKDTRVKTLAPLQGMPVQALYISGTSVTNLTPLQGMPLTTLIFTPKNVKDSLKIVKGLRTLQRIGVVGNRDPLPAAEFWKKFNKGELK